MALSPLPDPLLVQGSHGYDRSFDQAVHVYKWVKEKMTT